ncbi:hypothetical protein AVEN_236444-1 [Araneus ventricosus]|uniref:Uncharacterized protein n=1 Tax=Araneus ventricosus TaxID=182803 RepID=A0A4Y2ITW3_ARAVE|nr:hypothetical protein AVEN_236444-1 [Araneus ventricosus]
MFWKTSPRRQTAKHQTNSSTASVMNNIVTDITNPSQIHTNPAFNGKTTEAQCIQNDAEMSTSSALEDILEYNMSELEETSEESSEEICTPSPPKPRKYLTPTKYKNKIFFNGFVNLTSLLPKNARGLLFNSATFNE